MRNWAYGVFRNLVDLDNVLVLIFQPFIFRASVFQYEERNVSKLGLTLLELLRRLRLVDITSERRDEGKILFD